MKISQSTAQAIIDSLNSVLQQQLNFFDEKGTIIASTNSMRIGQFHGGVFKLITEHLPELIIHEDDEYPGSKKGVNLPVMLDGIVVGAIGITGEANSVRKYGQIIKRMTELQLMDSDIREKEKMASRIRSRFFDDWLLTNQNEKDTMFADRARRLGIDLSIPRRVVLMQISNPLPNSDNLHGQQKIDNINQYVRHATETELNGLFSKTSSLMILLLPKKEDDQLRESVEKLIEKCESKFHVSLVAGIDSYSDTPESTLHQSYIKASEALRSCLYSCSHKILFYDEATFELLLNELPDKAKKRFMNRVFQGLNDAEIKECTHLLNTLYRTNGSIARTADEHFMHKNTLQYKLNRIFEKTGFNPRDMRSVPLYMLAIMFYENYAAAENTSLQENTRVVPEAASSVNSPQNDQVSTAS